jgi:hypothetical protein
MSDTGFLYFIKERDMAKKTKPAADIESYKGFDSNLTCRGFQYEVGKTYHHAGAVVACPRSDQVAAGAGGFHACEYPLDVLRYYAPAQSRFAIVRQSGEIARASDDTKIASAKITIQAEVHIGDLIQRAVKWVVDRANPEGKGSHATGYSGAASATGDSGAASATGDSGAASATGDSGAASATGYSGAASATGDRGAASATGDSGAASATGDRGAASATGYSGAASATGDRGAASATGYRGAASATGYRGAASATGYRGAASATGDSGAASATGYRGAAMASGRSGRAQGIDGCALFLVHRDSDWNITRTWAGIVGQNGIKPMTWYMLDADGNPQEA